MEDQTKGNAIVVLITAPSQEAARNIVEVLLEKRLAACANIIPSVRSLYSWEGKMQDDEEVLMIIKTREELYKRHLVPEVQKIHPYEIPEIIALPVLMGARSYLEWIDEVTRD